MRILAVTTMKNEAPFILEWLAYHQAIGVTDFLIYTNDCEDGTDALLDELQSQGILHHERNSSKGKKTVQWKALSRAANHPARKEADWVLVSDVDEFLCIHAGEGKISDLMEACPEAVGFAIPWRMFGHNNVLAFQDKLIIEQFTRAAPEVLLWPWRAVQFKSLYRSIPAHSKFGVHRPRAKNGDLDWSGWVDGNGKPVRQVPGTVMPSLEARYGLAQMNHYALGSIENFIVKAERGKPNHTSDPIDLSYWIDRDFNQVEDLRALRIKNETLERMQEWRKNDTINQLHLEAVQWRRKRIHDLLENSDMMYLMARILQMGPIAELPHQQQIHLWNALIRVRRKIALEKQNDNAASNPGKITR